MAHQTEANESNFAVEPNNGFHRISNVARDSSNLPGIRENNCSLSNQAFRCATGEVQGK
jgi:hypothetical protein